ncbi:glycosyltransferase family 4 protein [Pilimelia columellifera]|uniref:Glycosyltransferase family 4 protein n=1 Tax=Pilimelia columellifera subsp. columellifera TaxID=706583 RepID=A0ABN3MZ30_9ACTN
MRVTYLTQYFRTPRMVGGTRAYEMARRLVDRGHEVTVVSGSPGADLLDGDTTTDEDGVTVRWLPVLCDNQMSFQARMRAFASFATRASSVAARLRHDLVFATSTPLTIAVPGVVAARRRGAPMVLEVRDLWPQLPIDFGALRSPVSRRAAFALESWAYRNAASVIALTPGIVDSIRDRFPGSQVHLVPNGADLELFDVDAGQTAALRQRHSWLGDRPVILYAGTVGLANGVDYLVRVAEQLGRHDHRAAVVIVGGGGELDAVRRQAAASGVLDRNLFVVGQVSKQEVPAWLSTASMAVSCLRDLPSLQGSAPNKVFDALAAGRPVAVNYGGWLTDQLVDAGAGIHLPPHDPAEGARRLAELIGAPDRLRSARAAAARLGGERFNRDYLFEQFHAVLLAAAGSPDSGQRSALAASRGAR